MNPLNKPKLSIAAPVNLIVGQVLFSLNVGNAARNCEQSLTEVIVIHVGNKYFKCKDVQGLYECVYVIDDWREKTKYSPSSFLYVSRQAYEHEVKIQKMKKKIASFFEWNSREALSDTVIEMMYACLPNAEPSRAAAGDKQ